MSNKKFLTNIIATRDNSIDFSSLAGLLPNPDQVLIKKGGGVSILKELTTDSHIWACLQSRKAGVKSLEWSINRGKAQTKTDQFIDDIFKKLDIYRIISEILDAPFWGYQPLEVIWQKQDNYIVPVDVVAKPSEWFAFDKDNQLRFLSKSNRTKGEELPNYKFLLAQYNPSYNNPYGERILSRCFWPYTFKKGGLKFWVTFTEKYGMPYIIAKHPRSNDEDDSNDLAEIMDNMVSDAIAVIPDDSTVEFLEAGGKGASADIYVKLIDHCNAEISKTILGQTLTTEIVGHGSYAASKTHQEVRQDIVNEDKQMVEKVMNQLIQWIWTINISSSDIPTFELWQEEDVDKNLAERDQILAATGVIFTKKYFQKAYGFEDEDFNIGGTQNEQNTPVREQKQDFSEQTSPVALFARHPEQSEGSHNDPQQQINNLISSFSNEKLQTQMNPLLKPLISKLKTAESYEQMMEIIATAYPDMDEAAFQQSLADALFISDIWGQLNAE
ncbi:MAG: DUF935 family protein [Pseudomonadota bacterium]